MGGDLSLREVVNAIRHTKMFNTYAATKKKQTQRHFMPFMLHRMVQWRSKFIPRHRCVCSCFKTVSFKRDNVSFVTVKGRTHREIKRQPIDQALGKARIAAPPAFHAPSGGDN